MNKRQKRVVLKSLLAFTLVLAAFGNLVMPKSGAHAATLTTGSMDIADPRPSETGVQYDIDFSNVTTSSIQCISVVFSDAATAGSVPTGMDTTGALLGASSDYIPTPASWTEDATTNGTVELTFGTGEAPASSSGRTVILTGIDNGSTAETTYYVQFNTYNNTDCSSSPVDSGVIAYTYMNGQLVSLTVDPTLSCAVAGVGSSQAVNGATTDVATTATTVPFGTVSSSANAIAAHDITVTTNATSGYTLYTRYTAALTNGASDTIDDFTGSNATPATFSAAGTEAFGYTSNDATLGTGTVDRFTSAGGNKWAAYTGSNLEVAYNAGSANAEVTRVGYQVGIAGDTEAGEYTSTVIYTCTPTY